MSKNIVVLDYGIGNIHSAAKAFSHFGANVTVTARRKDVMEADGLVIPGVGSFRHVMDALKRVHGPELIGRRLAGSRPVFGICVGMQVMFETGEEAETSEGLGEWPGKVQKLETDQVLPHMGWNSVDVAESSTIFSGIEDEKFYFVHSYAAQKWELTPGPAFTPPKVSWTTYGAPFISAIENGPLTATQFHPEKSGPAGLKLIYNWIQSLS